MAGYVGNIPVPQGTQTRQSFTATASQTSFPTIGYTAGFIDVYLNGVKLIDGTDFTASNGSDVVLTTAAAADDVLNVVIFDTFDTSSGTFSATTLKNDVTLKNDTEQDTDGGRASKIIYQGEQSGGEISTLAEIQASHDGTADDEKGDLIFRTNDGSDGTSPTEAMRITSQQRLGIGTNDPQELVHLKGADPSIRFEDTSGDAYAQIDTDSADEGTIRIQADPSNAGANSIIRFDTDGSERMRLNATGKLGIGKTDPKESLNSGAIIVEGDHATGVNAMGSSAGLLVHATGDTGFVTATSNGNNNRNLQLRALNSGSANANQLFLSYTGYIGLGTSSPSYPLEVSRGQSDAAARFARGNTSTSMKNLILFRSSSAGADVGSIQITNSATSYVTSSDHRLKENVETLSNGITRVKQLKPKRFSWIVDEEDSANQDGFLAHEAQTVVPESVTGTHDGIKVWEEGEELPDGVSVGDNKLDADGNTIPEYQGIDQAKLVPLLTAALQEAITKIETLETEMTSVKSRLDALEAE